MKYLLPDTGQLGRLAGKDENIGEKQVLPMNNLRISIPEVLFVPSDAGLEDGGITQAFEESMSSLHPELRSELISNIQIVGGSSQFPNLKKRLYGVFREKEIRSVLDPEDKFNLHTFEEYSVNRPSLQNYYYLSTMSENLQTTKIEEYFEMGSDYIDMKHGF